MAVAKCCLKLSFFNLFYRMFYPFIIISWQSFFCLGFIIIVCWLAHLIGIYYASASLIINWLFISTHPIGMWIFISGQYATAYRCLVLWNFRDLLLYYLKVLKVFEASNIIYHQRKFRWALPIYWLNCPFRKGQQYYYQLFIIKLLSSSTVTYFTGLNNSPALTTHHNEH